ncbi:MAG: c-type cytochrome biogenesis protein CcsB [Acidipropionibacterium acidipropionici]|jgi:cytochrome c-type biogenesis protein CcsB|uniref:Cytochrome c-type biogenesis protein CcsB n=1 Tax=Acidipropionibacterium acidipropionici (strain ATCC 4875 / DSM 20272 / JCM 6432 / NBRC 12425 / NCIMB 8070 / 4) TaxID=1171373 RepID=K7RVW7_ACIA4|nr:c-type cytochrome biogenesis protein CcsB [Acidipropionibacterium acidipropionici]AFV90561.1 Cytochrome c-type biogenesis protein CcsB [Acidipropionibacterium acidipropionici ATCC 4875]ALN15236.1 c-type cytochrome biogenesis protein CcsB [Acidipropionibacterium acidipropionici]APZ09013.1 c-type cytochrome biogenesis protein CcsB [Acidipropionibacterium acidipropionici]
MSLSNLSALGIVTAAVVYLLAFIAHVAEWAGLRGVSPATGEAGADAAQTRADAATRSEVWGRLGLNLTIIGAFCHALGVVCRGLAAHRAPWGNMYEFVTAALLFVVLAYLILVARGNLRWLGIGVTLLLAVGNGLAATVLYVGIAPLVPALHSVWFIIHIVAACLAAAALNVGAVASVLYLFRARAERKAERTGVPVTGFMTRVPASRTIDTVAYRAHAFGFPIWTFTIAAGSIWAEYAWGRFWGWDPKETWSLVTWVVYAGYLHARATAGWKGTRAAVVALIGIACFWFNFVGVNLFINGLHSYAGI